MKKYIILFYFVIALIIVNYLILFNDHSSSTTPVQINTPFTKATTDFTASLLRTNQVLADSFSDKQSDYLAGFSTRNKAKHMLALGYIDLTFYYHIQGKYKLSLEFQNRALCIAGKNDPEIYALLLKQYGFILYLQKPVEFKLTNDKMIDTLSDHLQSELLRPHSLPLNTGIDLLQNSNKNFCWDFYNSGKYMDVNMQYKYLMLCEQHLGAVYNYTFRYNKSIDCYNRALSVARQLDMKKEMAKMYFLTGEIYNQLNDFNNANLAFTELVKIGGKYINKKCMATAFRTLGELHFRPPNYETSLNYYNNALRIDLSLKLYNEVADDYLQIFSIYSKLGKISKEVSYCFLAEQYYKKANNLYGVSESNLLLGNQYFYQKNYDISFSFYRRALAQKKQINDLKGVALVYIQLSQLYVAKPLKTSSNTRDLQYALTFGIQAYQIANKLNNSSVMSDAARSVSEAYNKQKLSELKLMSVAKTKQISEKKYGRLTDEALQFAQIILNDDSWKQQIVSLKRQNNAILIQKKGETMRLKSIVFYLILFLGFGAISVVLFWVYTYRKREIINQQQVTHISILRLQNVRKLISPHMLFNFLNHEISSGENIEKNQSMIEIVTFLRRSLEIAEKISVTLEEEMDFVNSYLLMEQKSLDNDFKVSWDVDQHLDSRSIKIPAMIIQIPVDNALKHALRPKKGEKLLHISILHIDNYLSILIIDNGDGYHPERILETKGTGTGLKVLYQTIQVLNARNKENIYLNITNITEEQNTGTKVEVTIPKNFSYDI